MNFKFLFQGISLWILNVLLLTRAESINECEELKNNWSNNVYLTNLEKLIDCEINQELIDKLATCSEINYIQLIQVPLNEELNFKPFRNLNKLTSLSIDYQIMRKYKPLRVRNNVIKYFPNLKILTLLDVIIGKSALDEIGTLKNLHSLDISKTTFDEDSTLHSFKSLSNLTYLTIESYQKSLKRISTSINYLTNLDTLVIRANGADLAFMTHRTLKNLKNLNTLDVTNDIGLNLDKIGDLTNLEYLYLTCKNITSIPDSIGNLKKLKEIDLFGNPISVIPDTIGNLENLVNLYLGDNRIETLPDSIGNLKNLKYLYLARNQITEIPSSIGNMTCLERLTLSNNKLQSIPDSIGNLKNLKYLYLDHNNITTIPDSIKNSTTIKELYLSDNPINKE
ncbi:L domain-like protein [Anaeromyces robustus]|uniref:L domain-like protein n=1 Tax=Anaeromyces robustus TaxID=1754192 RepID=A0A1Y1WTI8_9FUNG|nr:L domain-like protein [Anaeromyces robustus]|eukprot:ORX76556.1 L domain-like protein [Anaeromyces robustus]